MARTTSTLVQGILINDYDKKTDLAPYIDSASVIIDRVLACATRRGVTLSATELELMERWLAAHAYAQMDRLRKKQEIHAGPGKVVGEYQGQWGMYLDSTSYGQFAQSLDASGCLAAIGRQKRASMHWLGLPPSLQTDYENRD